MPMNLSEEQANQNPTQQQNRLANLQHENRKLGQLVEFSKLIMSETDLNKLLSLLIANVSEVMDADRSTLFLIDTETQEIYSRVFQGDEVKEIRFPLGTGISGFVAESGEVLNIEDAYNDPRFFPDIDKRTGYRTKTLLCMPIRNLEGTIIGAVEVLNKNSSNAFSEEDIYLLEALSSLIAISLENAVNFEKVVTTMKTFRLFVPPKYLDRIVKQGIHNVRLGQAEKIMATVMFVDIRDFTSLSAGMSADEIARFLNTYFEDMNIIVSRHNGAIDKFMGDGFMAIFDDRDATSAINAAIDIKQHLAVYNSRLRQDSKREIRIGIGISTGEVTMGTIGSSDRMDWTCTGNAVVTAKRIEGLTKLYKLVILISHSTLYKIQDPERFHIREVDSIKIRGQSEPEVIYEIFDKDGEPELQQKEQSLGCLLQGIAFYKLKQWKRAEAAMEECIQLIPDDWVARIYRRRCQYYQQHPPDDSWDGTVTYGQDFFLNE